MDEMRQDVEYHVSLPEFEGPLDLLLHLVKRHELDIFDIPISFVTEKYIEYLDMMRSLNLDVAGEYLLMAATLAYIKSQQMLPRPEADDLGDDEEGEDPREELIRRLLEYQKYREVAEQLGQRPMLGRQVFPRGAPLEKVDPADLQLAEVGSFALIEALAEVARRTRVELTHDVMVDRISITDRINEIVDSLSQEETIRFVDCFAPTARSKAQLRHNLVVTFLAILEMARQQMIRIYQNVEEGEIYLTRTSVLHTVEQVNEEYGE